MMHIPSRAVPEGAMSEAAEQVSDVARQSLYQRVISEIAAIENAIAHLQAHGTDSDMDTTIAELRRSQTQLLNNLRDVQHARHPKQLRSIAASIDIAIRHSTETRQHAQAGQDSPEQLVKQIVRAAAVPAVGMVSLRFIGKPLFASDYRDALTLLQQRGKLFLQGITGQFKAHAEAASRHMVDIATSQQVQETLLQHARDAYLQDNPSEAAARLSEAATLSLRDAERVHGAVANAATDTMVRQAQHTAVTAARYAADQAQLDARRECTEQGKKDAELEACTFTGAAQRIDMLRVQMVRIQLYMDTPEQEAATRVERILQGVTLPEEWQLQVRQEVMEASAMLRRITITAVDAAQVRILPVETPGMAVAPMVSNLK